MKLVFKSQTNFEKILASARYKQFWEDNQEKILDSFYKHTGLTLKQRQITVDIRNDGRSKAGNRYQPMELSMTWKTEDGIGCTLIHELAHRLVIGNGIDPPEGNDFIERHANYYMHRHAYLFLYDVYSDILGKKVADSEVKRESVHPKSSYAKAWKWTLSKDYQQRQKSFSSIKKRYTKPL